MHSNVLGPAPLRPGVRPHNIAMKQNAFTNEIGLRFLPIASFIFCLVGLFLPVLVWIYQWRVELVYASLACAVVALFGGGMTWQVARLSRFAVIVAALCLVAFAVRFFQS